MSKNQPEKAYKNLPFLNSPGARPIRILCEYEEPLQRFEQYNIDDTLVFFGSARAKPPAEAEQALKDARAADDGSPAARKAVSRAEGGVKLARYYDDARELARRLTAWSMSRQHLGRNYLVCTGGGPGIMEAANRGAADVAGGRSVGLGISLPFEQGVNEWVTPELAFEFHYFFTRKYWFMYLMKAMIVFPGGFGTLDELFECLTLIQTGKMNQQIPIMLYGTSFWEGLIDLEALADAGTISPEDADMVFRCDSVDEAFDWITRQIIATESA